MNRRPTPKAAELISKAVASLAVAASLVAYFGISGPTKWVFGIAAMIAAFWSWRQKLPSFSTTVICSLLAVVAVLAIALYEGRDGATNYDFVATPYRKTVAFESWFPAPRHKAFDQGVHGYGEHVNVECLTENEYGEQWYGLPNGNYMLVEDLSPSPRTHREPPACD